MPLGKQAEHGGSMLLRQFRLRLPVGGEAESVGAAVVVEHGGKHWPGQRPTWGGEPGFQDLEGTGHQLGTVGGVGHVLTLVRVEGKFCVLECCGDAGDVHAGAVLLAEARCCGFLRQRRCPPDMCTSPADGDDEEGEEYVEGVVLAAGDVTVGLVDQADHVAAAVAV